MNLTEPTSSPQEQPKDGMISWLIVIGLALFFFAWGLFIFFTVGDKGPPAWNFGAIQDIPGESLYTDYGPEFVPGKGLIVPPQHVDTETTKPYDLQKELP